MPILAAYMVPHPPMIVPEVGRGSEHQIEATRAAYARIAREIAALAPETIIISSPHATMYADYFHISPGVRAEGSFARFRAPQVCFSEEYDAELARTIERMAIACGLPAGTRGQREPALDHGTLVPLYFIRQAYAGFRLVRVGLSGLPPACGGGDGPPGGLRRQRRPVPQAAGLRPLRLRAGGPAV